MIPLAEKAAADFRDKYWLQCDYISEVPQGVNGGKAHEIYISAP
jgi:hypothetical protein